MPVRRNSSSLSDLTANPLILLKWYYFLEAKLLSLFKGLKISMMPSPTGCWKAHLEGFDRHGHWPRPVRRTPLARNARDHHGELPYSIQRYVVGPARLRHFEIGNSRF